MQEKNCHLDGVDFIRGLVYGLVHFCELARAQDCAHTIITQKTPARASPDDTEVAVCARHAVCCSARKGDTCSAVLSD